MSYDPWVMGGYSVVRPMGHGRIFSRTTHGPWEDILSYDPMGHGECVLPDIVQSKGYGVPILFYNVVRSMGHGSYMPSYGPWAMGIYTPRTASYFPWVMGFCHIVFSMTHGKKVAEPCARRACACVLGFLPISLGIFPIVTYTGYTDFPPNEVT